MKNMKATAIIYEFKKQDRKEKEKIRRIVFGYKDGSNKGQYTYEREGVLTPIVLDRWGKSVIIVDRGNETKVNNILKKNKIKCRKVRINIEN